MTIRQAGLEPLALSASGSERMVYGWVAASEEKRIDFSVGSPVWCHTKRKGPLVAIGPRSVFPNSAVGVRQ